MLYCSIIQCCSIVVSTLFLADDIHHKPCLVHMGKASVPQRVHSGTDTPCTLLSLTQQLGCWYKWSGWCVKSGVDDCRCMEWIKGREDVRSQTICLTIMTILPVICLEVLFSLLVLAIYNRYSGQYSWQRSMITGSTCLNKKLFKAHNVYTTAHLLLHTFQSVLFLSMPYTWHVNCPS